MQQHQPMDREAKRAVQELEHATETLADHGLLDESTHEALTSWLAEIKEEYGLAEKETVEDEDEDLEEEVDVDELWLGGDED